MDYIRAVGFDLDLTLYKPDEEINYAICNYIIETARAFVGGSHRKLKKKCKNTYANCKSIRRTFINLGVPEAQAVLFSQEAIEKADIASHLRRDNLLVDMLRRIHEEYELFLITSSKKENALAKLHALGVDENIFSLPQYGRTEHTREDGSAFRYVSSTLKIPLEEMMFVGDREEVDIIPASNLGMMTVLVNHDKTQNSLATFMIKRIYDLENRLKEIKNAKE